MHASESTLDSGTASHSSRHDMLAIISSRYQYGPFFIAEVMSNYLTIDGLKNFFTSGGPLTPVARGIRHMVNPAQYGARFCVPLDTEQVISETIFPANLLARYGKKPKPNKTNNTNTKVSYISLT